MGELCSLLVFVRQRNFPCETGPKSRKKCALYHTGTFGGINISILFISGRTGVRSKAFLLPCYFPAQITRELGWFVSICLTERTSKASLLFFLSSVFSSLKVPSRLVQSYRNPQDCAVHPSVHIKLPLHLLFFSQT